MCTKEIVQYSPSFEICWVFIDKSDFDPNLISGSEVGMEHFSDNVFLLSSVYRILHETNGKAHVLEIEGITTSFMVLLSPLNSMPRLGSHLKVKLVGV